MNKCKAEWYTLIADELKKKFNKSFDYGDLEKDFGGFINFYAKSSGIYDVKRVEVSSLNFLDDDILTISDDEAELLLSALGAKKINEDITDNIVNDIISSGTDIKNKEINVDNIMGFPDLDADIESMSDEDVESILLALGSIPVESTDFEFMEENQVLQDAHDKYLLEKLSDSSIELGFVDYSKIPSYSFCEYGLDGTSTLNRNSPPIGFGWNKLLPNLLNDHGGVCNRGISLVLKMIFVICPSIDIRCIFEMSVALKFASDFFYDANEFNVGDVKISGVEFNVRLFVGYWDDDDMDSLSRYIGKFDAIPISRDNMLNGRVDDIKGINNNRFLFPNISGGMLLYLCSDKYLDLHSSLIESFDLDKIFSKNMEIGSLKNPAINWLGKDYILRRRFSLLNNKKSLNKPWQSSYDDDRLVYSMVIMGTDNFNRVKSQQVKVIIKHKVT